MAWYPKEEKWSLLPAGGILWLEGCSHPVLLDAKAEGWIFHPSVIANDSGQRNRCEGQHHPKRWVWSDVNLFMGPLPSCLAPLESRMDERQQPYAWTDGRYSNNYKCTTRLLCVWLPPLSWKGFWSLYRIIIKLMPNWAWNRFLSGYLGRMSDWTSLWVIHLFAKWKPFIGSSEHRTHLFHANLSLNNQTTAKRQVYSWKRQQACMWSIY